MRRSEPPPSHYIEFLRATSISRRVRESWHDAVPGSRVMAVFDRACNLVSPDGLVTSLVLEEIGNGPLNSVVDGIPGIFDRLAPGQRVFDSGDSLVVGGLRVAVDEAVLWEPRPDWDWLRQHWNPESGLYHLAATSVQCAPSLGLLVLLSDKALSTQPRKLVQETVRTTAHQAAQQLAAGWKGDSARLRSGAQQLAGLGEGLTPAGDDFLAGVMLWAWLTHPSPNYVCRNLLEEAAPRTTRLSAELLGAAAAGEYSAPWHRLLLALTHDHEQRLSEAARGVLAFGSTSGADSLAGFLWMEQATSMT